MGAALQSSSFFKVDPENQNRAVKASVTQNTSISEVFFVGNTATESCLIAMVSNCFRFQNHNALVVHVFLPEALIVKRGKGQDAIRLPMPQIQLYQWSSLDQFPQYKTFYLSSLRWWRDVSLRDASLFRLHRCSSHISQPIP